MNVASLGLCKELYELSGWGDTQNLYDPWGQVVTLRSLGGELPAYDLGYLLRKLPVAIQVTKGELYSANWTNGNDSHNFTADTPENALCSLAIELFKQGILKKEV